MPRDTPNVLMVEGADEKWLIPWLIEQNGIEWLENADDKESWIVKIEDCNGIDNILDRSAIEAEMLASKRQALGILIDADEDAHARWRRVYNSCQSLIPDLPDAMPKEGFIGRDARGVRLGVWIMPDNESRGMLETFLAFLGPDENPPLLTFSESACTSAKQHGAPYKDLHTDKTRIHTWLAWQDPPGRQLHQAVKERILRPDSPHAQPFVSWFRRLFLRSVTERTASRRAAWSSW